MSRLRAALLALSFAPATGFAAVDCHTALILGLDASRSVDARESRLQREGLAAALNDPEVVAAIAPFEGAAIAAMAFEWSNPGDQLVIAPWAVLDSPGAIRAFSRKLLSGPEIERRWKTGIGDAMRFAAAEMLNAPLRCRRRVVDISGDGPGNSGTPPHTYRSEGAYDGVTINGLVIRNPINDQAQGPDRDPLVYYRRYVIQGPGAFTIETDSYEDYPEAIRRKLLRELSPPLAMR